jgi:hypothetical protein
MYPIKPVRDSTLLQNVANGRIPRSALGNIGPDGFLIAPVARAFQALRYWAKTRLGVEVTWTYGGTYRDFDSQWSLWFQRWEAVSLAVYLVTGSSHRRIWRDAATRGNHSKHWRLRKNAAGRWLAPAAEPGTSNHGRAIAIDLALGDHPRNARGIQLMGAANWKRFCDAVVAFGFSWELQSEPWHIRYVLGDEIPQAVLDIEREMGLAQPPAGPPVISLPPPQIPPRTTEQLVQQLPALRQGDVSFHVHLAANMLVAHGHESLRNSPEYNQLRFGPEMHGHVMWFQGVKSLPQDGVIGPITWAALLGV